MDYTFEPLGDRVIVKPHPKETKTKGGLMLPSTAQENTRRGEVIAVGKGKPNEPLTVKVGDTVLFGKNGGTEIEGGLRVFQENHLLSIIKTK
jgi:chaperonin GroES